MSITAVILGPSLAAQNAAADDAFDWTLLMLGGPIVLLVVVGAIISAVRGKKKTPSATPYRSNARD